jgi:transcriptional antiterminator NusG
MDLDERTWHLVRHTPKVTGFVGGKNPAPIPDSEVEDIQSQMAEGRLKPKPKVTFTEGENVRVIDGPFSNFSGIVESIKADKGKVVVLVSIFGRATPVELDFTQVEKS